MVVTTRRPSLTEDGGNIRFTVAESGDEGLGEFHLAGTYNWVTSDTTALRVNAFTTDRTVANQTPRAYAQFLYQPSDNLSMVFRAEASERNLGPGTRVFLKRDDWTIGTDFGQIPQAVIDGLGLSGEALDNVLITNLHEISQTPTGPENDKTSAKNNRDYGFIDSSAASFELNYDMDSGHQLTFTSHYRNSGLQTNDSLLFTAVLAGRFLYEHQDFSLDVRDDGVPNVDVRQRLLWIHNDSG